MGSPYAEKHGGYFTATRHDMLAMLPQDRAARLLELGAGGGDTLLAAQQQGKAGELHGIDLVRLPNAHQNDPALTRFTVWDIETDPPDYPSDFFDAIVCADVLEHLRDPWATVGRLAGWLKPGGVLLASLPNIRHYFAMMPLLIRGDFRYQLAGPLDRTHYRFFARRNVAELFTEAGLSVERLEVNRAPYGVRQKLVDWLTLRLLSDCFVLQFRVLARKPH
jgi:2-polyprenyl-3-methyl-5-hydroxy-6-metoxy-1,4-benzoquinol methylase